MNKYYVYRYVRAWPVKHVTCEKCKRAILKSSIVQEAELFPLN